MRLDGIDAKSCIGGWAGGKTHDKHATDMRGKMQENKEVVGTVSAKSQH